MKFSPAAACRNDFTFPFAVGLITYTANINFPTESRILMSASTAITTYALQMKYTFFDEPSEISHDLKPIAGLKSRSGISSFRSLDEISSS